MSTSDSNQNRVGEIIAEYLAMVEAGNSPDQLEWISKYPEFAEQLQEFFADKLVVDDLLGTDPGKTPNVSLGATLPASPDKSASPANQSLVGSAVHYFGDYELLEEIARGGMGVVYKARQVSLNRIVAIKMILAGQLASQDDVKRFYTEAEAAANLDHPGIVPIYEVGQHNGQHYYSMGFVDGMSLAERLIEGPLPADESTRLVKKVADAVAFAHDQGVIHRDLKPGNILLDFHGNPRVVDFGLARKIETDSTLTGTGQILGTPGYMAPEQVKGDQKKIGPVADVYALGAILYCTLTGRPPFQFATPMETMVQVLNAEPVAPRQINPDIPRDLETICLRCLAKDSSRRFSSAHQLIDDLDRFQNGQPIVSRPISRLERTLKWARRYPARAGVVFISFMAIAILSMSGWWFSLLLNEQKQNVQFERDNAIVEKRASKKLLSILQVERGQKLLENDDGTGLLYLVQGCRTAIDSGKTSAESDELKNRWASIWKAWYLFHADSLLGVFGNDNEVLASALNPSAALLAIATDQGVFIYDSKTGEQFGEKIEEPLAFGLHFYSDERLVVSRSNGQSRIWDLSSGFNGGVTWRHVMNSTTPSADGRVVFTRSNQKVVINDSFSGEALGEPWILDGRIDDVVFSPGDSLLAVVSQNQIIVYDSLRGEQLAGPLICLDRITAVTFSADCNLIAARSKDGIISIWNVKSSEQLANLNIGGDFFAVIFSSGMLFNPDGTLLAAKQNNDVYIFDVKSGEQKVSPLRNRGTINSWTFSPDGTLFATASNDGAARIWETASGNLVGQSQLHGSAPTKLHFSPDGTFIAIQNLDRIARLWKIADSRELFSNWPPPAKNAHPYIRSACSEDAQWIAAISNDEQTVSVWDTQTWQAQESTIDIENQVVDVAISREGDLVALASEDMTIDIWSTVNGRRIGQPISTNTIQFITAFSPDSRQIAGIDEDGIIRIWETASGKSSGEPLKGKPDQVAWTELRFSPNGHFLIARNSYRYRIWRPETGRQLYEDEFIVACTPDGHRVAIVSQAELRIVDSDSGEVFGKSIAPGDFVSTAIRSDGKMIAAAYNNGAIQLWNTMTGKMHPVSLRTSGAAIDMAFSPNGETLATASGYHVRLWNISSGYPCGPAWTLKSQVVSVAFSPDGKMLIKPALRILPQNVEQIEELQLRTWVALGSRLNDQGVVETLSSTEWQRLRNELTFRMNGDR